jgi:hypothetical protein
VSALPTRTVTFLFTDVEGSTRLLDELGGERYGEALDVGPPKLARRLGLCGESVRGHCVDIGVVKGVHRARRRDRNAKARAGCPVADAQLDSVDLGPPKQEYFERPAQPSG